MKLKKMPYAQADVRILDDGTIILRSYSTDVITISNNILTVTGLYSATTRKHISAFMREYTNFNYQAVKFCYENNCALLLDDNCAMNRETGEVFYNDNWRV